MPTEIPCVFHDSHHLVIDQDNDKVRVKILGDSGRLILTHRAEFLAAIATELDVIIIPRSELPEVTKTDAHDQPDRDHYVRHRDTGQVKIMRGKSAEKHRRWATEHLALAEHLEAHPPVDEAQVDALAKSLMDARTEGDPSLSPAEIYHDFARRLVAAGVRAPQAGDDQ